MILTWWVLAFSFSAPETLSPKPTNSPLFNRDKIHKALLGNTALMTELLSEWGVSVKENENKKQSSQIRNRLLPQTFVAASFLFSLCDPVEILAIPKTLRSKTAIFPSKLTSSILYDIDRFSHETLFMMKPKLAFVASYSHPATLNTLRKLNIPLHLMQPISTISELKTELLKVGKLVGRSQKSALLTQFIDATFNEIDLRLQNLVPKKVLYMRYGKRFTVPTDRTLIGKMIERLGMNRGLTPSSALDWNIPISQEIIVKYQPEIIIVSTTQSKAILSMHSLKNTPAGKEGLIYFVDDSIQQFPSQFITLAYLDLAEILLGAPL